MRRQKLLTLVCVLLIGIPLLSINPHQTYAQELPPGMVIGDDKGLKVNKEGQYLVDITDVMPGKTWQTTIAMINMEKNDRYRLSMLVSPSKVSGSLDLSEAIHMRLTYDKQVVYEGPVSGVSQQQNLQSVPLELGIFEAGDSRALTAAFSLSGTYTKQDFQEKNTLENTWTFYAVKTTDPLPNTTGKDNTPSKPTKIGRLPSTGDIRAGMIFLCIGLFLLLIVLLVWKAKKTSYKENKARKEAKKDEENTCKAF